MEAFQSWLKSIDIRTIAVKPPQINDWQNLITVIRFSDKEVEEVRNDQNNILSFKNDYFAILTDARPSGYQIIKQIEQGQIAFRTKLGDFQVQNRKPNLSSSKMRSDYRWINGTRKCFLCSAGSGQEQERTVLWNTVINQLPEITRLNYENVEELFSEVTGLQIRHGDRTDFEIFVSSGAHIESSFFNEKSFEFKIVKPIGITGLQVNLSLKRYVSHNTQTVWRKIIQADESQEQTTKYSIQPDKILPLDYMEIKLIHKASALTLDSTSCRAPIKNVLEPFMMTLDSFCELDEYRKMLLEPQKNSKRPQEMFENAVMWLLAMTGLSPIHLGIEVKDSDNKSRKFDVLRYEGGYEFGCADIVVYSESNLILLIDCDTGVFVDEKIRRLAETRKYFQTIANIPNFALLLHYFLLVT